MIVHSVIFLCNMLIVCIKEKPFRRAYRKLVRRRAFRNRRRSVPSLMVGSILYLTNPNLVNQISQEGRGTKAHVYLPYRGAISFYVYIVPSGLISIFLDVEYAKISCGLQPTRFS